MTLLQQLACNTRTSLAIMVLALSAAACGGGGDNQTTDAGRGGFGPRGGAGFGGGFSPGQRPGGGGIPAVEAVQAQLGTLPLEERLTGRASAWNQTEIYPEVAGILTEIFVQNGDYVEAGDPLVQLRDAEYAERYQQAQAGLEIAQAQTRQARANLELLESQLRRTRELVERKLETTANLETIQSQVAVGRADLDLRSAQENQARSLMEERRLQMLNTTIRAPISGTVGQRNAEAGQLATTSARLFVIGDLDRVRIEVLLTERMLNYIREGMPVNLTSENWPDRVLESNIDRISPFLDPTTLRTQAFIEMDNPGGLIRPGMFLTVDVLYGESRQAVLIPNSALYRHPRTGMEGIFVVADPGEELTHPPEGEESAPISPPVPVNFVPIDVVATGRMASGVEGIKPGDWVVTVGQNLLASGNVPETRARLMSWDRIIELQRMQNSDLYEVIDRKQRELGGDS